MPSNADILITFLGRVSLYDAESYDRYDDYYGYYDDDTGERIPTVIPTTEPTIQPNSHGAHPTFKPTIKHHKARNALLDGIIARATSLSSYVTESSSSSKWHSTLLSAGVGACLGLVVAVVAGVVVNRNRDGQVEGNDDGARARVVGGGDIAYDALPTEDPI